MGIVIVGIGGTTRANSSTERAMRAALAAAAAEGAETVAFGGPELMLPLYTTDPERTPAAERLVAEMRRADGYIVASPGYHGTISGLIKNALDYTEDMNKDERPYFDGRAVGCIGIAYGWQAAMGAVNALRDIAHALRGWPTPLGVTLNSLQQRMDGERCEDAKGQAHLELLGKQVVEFARMRQALQG